MRVAIYARYSSENQRDASIGVSSYSNLLMSFESRSADLH